MSIKKGINYITVPNVVVTVGQGITLNAEGSTIDEEKIVCPLTITPKISMKPTGAGAITEADFTNFLKAGKTAKTKKFDLNGDGKRDYIDDYIFTANYVSELNQSAIKSR